MILVDIVADESIDVDVKVRIIGDRLRWTAFRKHVKSGVPDPGDGSQGLSIVQQGPRILSFGMSHVTVRSLMGISTHEMHLCKTYSDMYTRSPTRIITSAADVHPCNQTSLGCRLSLALCRHFRVYPA